MAKVHHSRFWWRLLRFLVKEFVVAGGGRVFQGVESPSRRGEEETGHKECVGSTAAPRQEHVGASGVWGMRRGVLAMLAP